MQWLNRKKKQTAEVVIVRKTLRQNSSRLLEPGKRQRQFLERETECLQILDRLRHPNIVRLLASYSHLDKHHFLFPLYPLDLEKFLGLGERFGEFKKDRTFYTALEGLSSALEKVHSLNLNQKDHDVALARIGYHHDLRPGNVLVDSRAFYLSDFGLARLKPEDKGSRTQWKSGLGDYVAPECMDENMRSGEVGRALDIWSLGCMISEVAAYIEGGPNGVSDFQKQRIGNAYSDKPNMKDHYFFTDRDLRPKVTLWFKDFRARSECPMLDGLLDVAGLMLKIDPTERPKAATVHQLLLFLSAKSLFAAVQQSLNGYREAAPYAARFADWGKVLRFTESASPLDFIRAMSDKSNLLRDIRDILASLLGKLEPDEKAPSTEAALPIPNEELAGSINKLWTSGPIEIQGNLLNTLVTGNCADQALHDAVSNTMSTPDSELVALTPAKLEAPASKELQLTSGELSIERDFGEGLSVGSYRGKQVLLEWVSPTEKRNKMRVAQFKTEDFRLPSKPRNFRVPDHLGYVLSTSHTAEDYAFVWEFPSPTPGPAIQQTTVTPINLLRILQSKEEQHKKIYLPLGEKFQLAYKLVNCVWELSSAGYLHRNISSRSIVFFEQEGGASTLSEIAENPYLVNFQHPRMAENTGHTHQAESSASNTRNSSRHDQHPDCSSSASFLKIYDYYSTGIVLLELGSWIPLDTYQGNNSKILSNRAAFRDRLVSTYVPRLSHLMGDTYRDATLACLRSDFERDTSSGVEGQIVHRQFYDKVVCPLRELSGYAI